MRWLYRFVKNLFVRSPKQVTESDEILEIAGLIVDDPTIVTPKVVKCDPYDSKNLQIHILEDASADAQKRIIAASQTTRLVRLDVGGMKRDVALPADITILRSK